jgi:urease accessory protein
MLTISKRIAGAVAPDLKLTLPFDDRKKSRLRTQLANGEEVGLILERGTLLRGGDLVEADDGRIIEIVAAQENVSTVRSSDPWALSRASYHLGNRHVALQIGQGWVRYQHDHVLDEMVRGLGLEVSVEQAAFEPEAGAYGAGAHPFVQAPHRHHHD